MSATTHDTCSKTYSLQIRIDAPPADVWRALTDEIDAWWLPDFHMVASDSVLELAARAGGQLIESRAGGGSLLWYTVIMVQPQESLHMVGHVAPGWGGPATSMLSLKLEAQGDGADVGTLLIVQDALFGQVSDEGAASLEQGWRQLFGEGLKRHVESA